VTGDAVAATIAHEVRQPLTAMVTSADAGLRFLDRAVPNLERAKGAFRRISADGHRANEVVGGIRAMFRKEVRPMHPLDVNEVIREALALEREHLSTQRILVRVDAAAPLPQVEGDRVQLQQVVMNLITNAIDAMAVGDDPRLLCVRSEAYGTTGVIVSVSDSGAGIGSLEAERIFNPLFTTKPDGMGMGLAICRSIVEAHDGRLWTEPNSPRGTTFHFTLHATPETIVQ
jgi:signal transduction histidine kinase